VLRRAIAQGLPLTDDCSAMEAAGRPVGLTPGDVENLKITTPVDLRIAEAIWKGRTT
jgi:2-C-methyl-D-erythritol 4-phosphate cytidylyltransferase